MGPIRKPYLHHLFTHVYFSLFKPYYIFHSHLKAWSPFIRIKKLQFVSSGLKFTYSVAYKQLLEVKFIFQCLILQLILSFFNWFLHHDLTSYFPLFIFVTDPIFLQYTTDPLKGRWIVVDILRCEASRFMYISSTVHRP